jgi:hypothetical protein
MCAAFINSYLRVPAVGLNLPKKFIINHHPRTAMLMVVEMHKTIVTKFFRPPGKMLGQDVGVNVYFKHR